VRFAAFGGFSRAAGQGAAFLIKRVARLEKVAWDFAKILTTCTETVSFESLSGSKQAQRAAAGRVYNKYICEKPRKTRTRE